MIRIGARSEGLGLSGRSTLMAWDEGALAFYGHNPLKFELAMYWKARRMAKLNGHLRDVDVVENMIVNAGLNLALDMLIDEEDVGLTYHGIGTDGTTPVATNTTMNTEVKRKPWNTRARTAQVISLSTFYLASECTYAIVEEGVFGGVGATASVDTGDLFSHYLRPYDNAGGTYDLTFDYDVTAARG